MCRLTADSEWLNGTFIECKESYGFNDDSSVNSPANSPANPSVPPATAGNMAV